MKSSLIPERHRSSENSIQDYSLNRYFVKSDSKPHCLNIEAMSSS
jgi:hypothetical protein